MPDLELRTVTVPEAGHDGTRLFAALDRALADIPRSRLAGVVMLTDGLVHDVPRPPPPAPLHVLLPAPARRPTAASASSRRRPTASSASPSRCGWPWTTWASTMPAAARR